MEIQITDKPEAPEGDTFADKVTIDQAGIDLHFENGKTYSANWGEYTAEEVATAMVWADFQEVDSWERELILKYMKDFVAKLERNVSTS